MTEPVEPVETDEAPETVDEAAAAAEEEGEGETVGDDGGE